MKSGLIGIVSATFTESVEIGIVSSRTLLTVLMKNAPKRSRATTNPFLIYRLTSSKKSVKSTQNSPASS